MTSKLNIRSGKYIASYNGVKRTSTSVKYSMNLQNYKCTQTKRSIAVSEYCVSSGPGGP